MKKSYIIASSIFLGLAVIGMIAYYCISTYGPGSDRAQMKKRVEYVLESYGAINHNSGTWSTYKPNEGDLRANVSSKSLCSMIKRETYETEAEARKAILLGVIFDIEEVKRYDDKYVVTVNLTRTDKTDGICYFIFERKTGEWVLDGRCIELAAYVGNGMGGSGSTLLDLQQILAKYGL